VTLNSIFGFGGKVDRRGFETCSSHLSPRNEPMNTSFEMHRANTHNFTMVVVLTWSNQSMAEETMVKKNLDKNLSKSQLWDTGLYIHIVGVVLVKLVTRCVLVCVFIIHLRLSRSLCTFDRLSHTRARTMSSFKFSPSTTPTDSTFAAFAGLNADVAPALLAPLSRLVLMVMSGTQKDIDTPLATFCERSGVKGKYLVL
jgi:hypothetical protein